MAPKGTPPAALKALSAALVASVDSPKLQEAFRQEGAEPLTVSPAEFEALMRSEADKYGKVIQAGGIKPE